jgi:hypothetical protein
MAKILIGGVERSTAPMNFKTWKRAWVVFARVRNAPKPEAGEVADPEAEMQAVSDLIQFVSCALSRSENEADRLSAEQIEEDILASEIVGLQLALPAIMEENSFKSGEAPAAAESA